MTDTQSQHGGNHKHFQRLSNALSLERGATTHNRKVGAKKRRQASEGLNAVSRAGFLGNRGLADRFEMGTRLRFEAEGASRGFTGGTGGMSG